MKVLHWGVLSALLSSVQLFAQTANIPATESFDLTAALPPGWSSEGFVISSSVPRSSPHCVSATGNVQERWVRTQTLLRGSSKPALLRWHERRTTSALSYRLAVYMLGGADSVLLAVFDTIPSANSYASRSMDLSTFVFPDSFALAWSVLRDSLNSTGVLRLDDIVVTAELPYDIAVTVGASNPFSVFPDSPSMVPILIRNQKNAETKEYAVRCSATLDRTGAIVYDRLFSFSPLGPFDSIAFPLFVQFSRPGAYTVTAELVWPDDGDTTNNNGSAPVEVWYRPASVVINEVMVAPQKEDESDWVELLVVGPDSVDLAEFTVSDKGTQRVPMSPTSTVVAPGEYVVLASRPGMDILYPDIGTFLTLPSMPSFNNTTSDAVVIRSVFGGTIDSVLYQPGWAPPGISLERRSPTDSSHEPGNWVPSVALAGATPGQPNSARQRAVDIALRSAIIRMSETDETVMITIVLVNEGTLGVPSGQVSLLADIDLSGTFETGELVRQIDTEGISVGDSSEVDFSWIPPIAGRLSLCLSAKVSGDENPRNDTMTVDINTRVVPGSIKLNEITFTPSSGHAEWVELYNAGTKPVNMQDLTLSDRPSPAGNTVLTKLERPVSFPPGAYAVVASDSSVLSDFPWLKEEQHRSLLFISGRASGLGLNADEDAIILRDEWQTIDSVVYWSSWHAMFIETTGRSLERIHPDAPGTASGSWTSSAAMEGGTPGKVNSVTPHSLGLANGVTIAPNPFSPDGDGREDVSVLRYAFDVPGVHLRVRVYSDRGREVRTLLHGDWVEPVGVVSWDGRNDDGGLVPIGPYIGVIQAWNAAAGFSRMSKHVIVVAR